MSYYIGAIICTPTDELQHFGIKGMHWGIRRYQNEDGSLTAAGKARYGYSEGMSVRDSKKRLKSLEKEHAQLNVHRNYDRFKSTNLLEKATKQYDKAEALDAKGKTKARDKYIAKANKSLEKSRALNKKVGEIENLMKTAEGEQWKHIANLLANNVSVTSTERTKFVMTRGAQFAQIAFGVAGSAAYALGTGRAVGDYVNTNKYKFGKGSNLNLVNKTNPRKLSALERSSDTKLRKLKERAAEML